MENIKQKAMDSHREWAGKLEITSRAAVDTREALSLAYTPGVAEPCLAIRDDADLSYKLTRRWNLVAVVTDGTAVLGLGDIGPEAGMPVMEGKCVLFKEFGGVDAFPLCIRSKDTDTIVDTIALLAGSFGGVNLEDISAPRCFEIERRLQEKADIPVFHDDQHGTAVVTAAAVTNAMRLTGRRLGDQTVVICGAGAAGVATARLLMRMGAGDILLCDRQGIIYEGREGLDGEKRALAALTNRTGRRGDLAAALRGADIFIGLSGPGLVTGDMVRAMSKDPVVLPMSNPTPEIWPDEARRAGAALIGTGRSDFPNQVNNVLAFPGIFRGALDVRARCVNDEMKLAAVKAIAGLVPDGELSVDCLLPEATDRRVGPAVAKAVAAAARASGAARL